MCKVGHGSFRVAWWLLPRLYISPNALGQPLDVLVSYRTSTFLVH
jgi:hypothetical protein